MPCGPSTLIDSGLDGADAGDAARFCESQIPTPFLCADFDGTDLLEGWTGQTTSAGSLVEDDAGFKSPPASLLAAAIRDGGNGGPLPTALLYKSFTRTVTSVHLELDVQPNGSTTEEYASVQIGAFALTLGIEMNGLHFVEEKVPGADGGPPKLHPFTSPFVSGTWYHVVLDATLTGTRMVDVHVNGVHVLAADPLVLSTDPVGAGTFRCGLLFVEPGAFSTRFDNVVLNL